MPIRLLIFLCISFFSGCVAQQNHQHPQRDIYTLKTFNAPIDALLSVETGESIFVEGEYIEGEYIEIPESIDLMIPGSMMIPFPVHIESGHLNMKTITSSWKYYCADNGMAAASFPGLGSVVREGDCIGIRISTSGKEREWVVDNSNYNKGWDTTIWSKNMREEEILRYRPSTSNKPFKVKSIKKIVFNGFYGGQIHFSWENISDTGKEQKEFIFDFENYPTLVGIKGNQFVLHSADNVKLIYEWKKIKR